ncbi:hypothetical protein DFH29DRAFT_304376 [Suillus ampliporus]|nr:hypothetical protein DFH29DRAFT_304376 [Suillus ampliporus]
MTSKPSVCTITTTQIYLMAPTDSACEATLSPPKGWTENIFAADKIKPMPASSAGKPVDSAKDMLEEVRGDLYVFSSGNNLICSIVHARRHLW